MADNNNTIKTTVELDASQAEKSIDKLNNAKGDSIALDDKAAKSQSSLSKAISKTDDASGGLLTKMKALVTNPVGLVITALVAAFAFLSKAVSRSGKASDTFAKIGAKLSGVMNGLLAVVEPLVIFIGEKLLQAFEDPQQAIEDLGNSLKENIINRFEALSVLGGAIAKLFKGDFKGALKSATDGFVQLTTGVTDATDKAAAFGETASEAFNKAAQATQDLAGAERALAKIRIQLEKQQLVSLKLAEDQRQIRDDTSKSISERINANKELGKILDEQAKSELALAQQALSFAKSQQAATGTTIENIEAVGDAEIKILEIRERITGQRSEQLVNETGLLKEQSDKNKELALSEFENQVSIDELRIQQIKDRGESTLEAELELLEAKRSQELENVELTELGKKEIEERFKVEKAEIEKAEEERKAEEDAVKEEALIESEALKIEQLKEKGEATLERELALLERKREQDVREAGLTAEQISLINEKAEVAKSKLRTTTEKAERDKEKAILDTAISGAAEAFGVSQELATAKMIMNAPEALGNVWANAAKQPTLPQVLLHGAVGSVTTLAPIVKGLKDIKNTRFSKSKGSAPSGNISASTSSSGSSSLSSSTASNVAIDPVLSSNAGADAANNVLGSSQSSIVFSENRYDDFKRQVEFKEDRTGL